MPKKGSTTKTKIDPKKVNPGEYLYSVAQDPTTKRLRVNAIYLPEVGLGPFVPCGVVLVLDKSMSKVSRAGLDPTVPFGTVRLLPFEQKEAAAETIMLTLNIFTCQVYPEGDINFLMAASAYGLIESAPEQPATADKPAKETKETKKGKKGKQAEEEVVEEELTEDDDIEEEELEDDSDDDESDDDESDDESDDDESADDDEYEEEADDDDDSDDSDGDDESDDDESDDDESDDDESDDDDDDADGSDDDELDDDSDEDEEDEDGDEDEEVVEFTPAELRKLLKKVKNAANVKVLEDIADELGVELPTNVKLPKAKKLLITEIENELNTDQ